MDRLSSRLALVLVAMAALWFHTYELGRRPMHADEANQAVRAGQLLETGEYTFDPIDHHGPTLYYAAVVVARLRGQTTLAGLTETTVRLVPAIAGTFTVLLIAALAAPLGRWPAVGAAALYAVSPIAVYYSRDFIQETLLGTFLLATFMCARVWWRSGHLRWSVVMGVAMALALATKASAPVYMLAAGVAAVCCKIGRPASPSPMRDLTVSLCIMLVITALLYSSFGHHLRGIEDALASYGVMLHRSVVPGAHAHAWWFYIRPLIFYRSGGLLWQQLAFIAMAIGGIVVGLIRRDTSLTRWATIYTIVIALVLSLTPYKTPWNGIHLVPGLALLAAGGLAAIPWSIVAIPLATLTIILQGREMWRVVFLRPADVRNPYAYVQSVPDVLAFRPLAEAALARNPGGVIRVISEEYWPLPWYFRGLPRVGYWTVPPAQCDGAVVVTSASEAAVVRARLHGVYQEYYLGLRPNFVTVVFVAAR